MTNIYVGRYSDSDQIGYQGWIEPIDRTWIMFITNDGSPTVFLHRDPDTGAVL